MRQTYALGLLFAVGAGCGGGPVESKVCRFSGCDGSDPLVDAAWLEDRLEQVQLLDTRAASDHAAGHIPGAAHVEVASLVKTADGVPSQVVSAAEAQAVLSEAGLEKGQIAVIYGGGIDTASARLLWTLQYFGHADVRYLDGGFNAWVGEGRPVEEEADEPQASTYAIDEAVADRRVDAAWVLEHLEDPEVALIDARSPGEYLDGHIPGALSVPWPETVDQGLFRSRDEVSELFADVDGATTYVTYCQTGFRASVAYLALVYIGKQDVRVYDGSWAEWGSRDDLPREIAARSSVASLIAGCDRRPPRSPEGSRRGFAESSLHKLVGHDRLRLPDSLADPASDPLPPVRLLSPRLLAHFLPEVLRAALANVR